MLDNGCWPLHVGVSLTAVVNLLAPVKSYRGRTSEEQRPVQAYLPVHVVRGRQNENAPSLHGSSLAAIAYLFDSGQLRAQDDSL